MDLSLSLYIFYAILLVHKFRIYIPSKMILLLLCSDNAFFFYVVIMLFCLKVSLPHIPCSAFILLLFAGYIFPPFNFQCSIF